MTAIRKINGSWFAYCDDRVLGPFKTQWRAIKAARDYQYEIRSEQNANLHHRN